MGQLANTWQFWALMAAVFASLTAIFAKLGVMSIDPDLATFLRTIVILVLLGLIVLWKQNATGLAGLTPRAAIFLVLSGLATGASWLCYFRALHLGDASKVAPVDKLSVVFVAVIAALFLGEKLSSTGWTGVALIAAGSILVASS
ncbi:MAG: EamA family transporter [Sulfitobacter sp.]